MFDALVERAAAKCARFCCEQAVRLLEKAVRLQPENPELHFRLGICHSGGCRLNSLTNPDLAVGYLRHALSLTAASEDVLRCAAILDALGNAYAHARQLPKKVRFKASLDCHRAAAAIYKARDQLDDWAREEYNQGNAWCELPEAEYPHKWQQAVLHYERALQVRTRDRNPLRHAATLQNLGTAYRRLPTGNRAANVRKAADCYRRALRVFGYTDYPTQYAALQNNLGNAYLSLATENEEEQQRRARQAIAHLNLALRIRTRAEHPVDFAVTQYNRGLAFLFMAAREPRRNYVKAAACFQEAQECFLLGGRPGSARSARRQVQHVRFLAMNGHALSQRLRTRPRRLP